MAPFLCLFKFRQELSNVSLFHDYAWEYGFVERVIEHLAFETWLLLKDFFHHFDDLGNPFGFDQAFLMSAISNVVF